MAKNQNKSSMASYNAKSHGSLSAEPQACLSGNKIIYPIDMNRGNLMNLSKEQLVNMLLSTTASVNKAGPVKQTASTTVGPVFKPKSLTQLAAEKLEQSIKKTAVLPKQSNRLPTLKTLAANAMVKDKIKYFEKLSERQALIIRLDKNTMRGGRRPIPALRTKKQLPVAAPRKKIGEKRRAVKGFTKSYEIGLKTDRDALVQLQNTRLAISRLFNTILNNTKGFKFVETLKVTFVKREDDDNIYKPAYFNSRAQIVINPNAFLSSLQLSQQQLLNGIGVWLSEGSGWTISSIDEHYTNIARYEPMQDNSYIPLPVKLQNPANGLINLQNKVDECFRRCHIRYLNPQSDHPQRIKKEKWFRD